jgi:hypothetical protein
MSPRLAGPNPTNYQDVPNFTGSDGTSTTPFLLPPTIPSLFKPGKRIEIDVSNVFGKGVFQANNSCGISTDSNNVDFTLSWGEPPLPVASIFVQPNNVWQVSATARATLSKSFARFREQLDELEYGGSGCLIRGGASLISQRVAEALPLTLAETLAYRYGLNASDDYLDLTAQNRYLDIQPGMRLRVEFSGNQFLNLTSMMNGYVGTGVGYYQICGSLGQDGIQYLAFDAFLGAMPAPPVVQPPPNPDNLAGGIIDLQTNGSARRYYRLFFPTSLPNTSTGPNAQTDNAATIATSGSSILPLNYIALVGANTLSDLNAATAAYQNGAWPPAPQNSIIWALFRGRDIAVPEIVVYVNGTPVSVPVGSTVRNLVETQSNLLLTPYVTAGPQGGNQGNNPNVYAPVQLLRQFMGIAPPGWGIEQTQYYPVAFMNTLDPSQQQYATSPDIYDLPLVKGDMLTLSCFGG